MKYIFNLFFCILGNILASGGGTADRCIRIWNSSNGTLLNTVDTKSQVCSLLWAPEYKELVSAHGYANNEIAIWKYPSMVSLFKLKPEGQGLSVLLRSIAAVAFPKKMLFT